MLIRTSRNVSTMNPIPQNNIDHFNAFLYQPGTIGYLIRVKTRKTGMTNRLGKTNTPNILATIFSS